MQCPDVSLHSTPALPLPIPTHSMAAVSSVGSVLACAILPHHWAMPHSAAAWALLAAVGLLGCGVQLLATTALKLSRAAPVIAMSYLGGEFGVCREVSSVRVQATLVWMCKAWALFCWSVHLRSTQSSLRGTRLARATAHPQPSPWPPSSSLQWCGACSLTWRSSTTRPRR